MLIAYFKKYQEKRSWLKSLIGEVAENMANNISTEEILINTIWEFNPQNDIDPNDYDDTIEDYEAEQDTLQSSQCHLKVTVTRVEKDIIFYRHNQENSVKGLHTNEFLKLFTLLPEKDVLIVGD